MNLSTPTLNAKRAPGYFLFVALPLIALISIYEQEKLLQIHHFPSVAIHHHAGSTSRRLDSADHLLFGDANGSSKMLRTAEENRPPPFDYTDDLLFGDAVGSAKILMRTAQKKRPVFDEAIDDNTERARCARYKLGYTPGTNRRNLFWGGLLADDSWHIVATQAIETYGVFHTAAFVESNRTQMFTARPLRFGEGSSNKNILTQTGMFGPSTKVTVDYYVNEDDTLISLARENAQRSVILERWKRNGMTKDDIGFLSDPDEVFTRDFLRAIQICDVPQFKSDGKDGHNKCFAPKVYGLMTIFESSPECVSSEEHYRPALMIGECIEGIGDSTVHPTPSRYKNISTNWREPEYTYGTYYSALHNKTNPPPPKSLPPNVNFPLWNAADFRRNAGGFFYGDDKLPLFIGYHIHNFFAGDMTAMRTKYRTYGHPIDDALTKPLSEMNREVNLMVRCAQDDHTIELERSVTMARKYKTNEDRRKDQIAFRKGGLEALHKANYGKETGGAVPLAFRIEEYVTLRHKEMVQSVNMDEEERLRAIGRALT